VLGRVLGEGRRVALGGWSFGGVVAVEVARLLKARAVRGQESAEVDVLLLFDAPLRVEKGFEKMLLLGKEGAAEHEEEEGEEEEEEEEEKVDVVGAMRALQGPGADEGLIAAAAAHFASCTKLLRAHASLAAASPPLACPLVSCRPFAAAAPAQKARRVYAVQAHALTANNQGIAIHHPDAI
jgi:thioesterase domain-containing protein